MNTGVMHKGPEEPRGNRSLWPNPSIERTSQRPLCALWSTAHVERWAPVGETGSTRCTVVEAGSRAFVQRS